MNFNEVQKKLESTGTLVKDSTFQGGRLWVYRTPTGHSILTLSVNGKVEKDDHPERNTNTFLKNLFKS